MKRILSGVLYLVLIALSFSAVGQQVFKTTSATTIGYLEYLPRGYKNDSKKYPVLIFLHGIGERGPTTTNRSSLERASRKVMKIGPPHHIKNGAEFPFIVISPQLKSRHGTWPVWYVMEVIEHVKRTLRIDEDRIYLSGLSLGGGGAWTVAQEHPEIFAALAPVCGGYNSPTKAGGIAAANLPVWAFHGDRDPIVPLGRSSRMIDAINSHRPDPRAKLTVYKGVKHDAWENAYRPGHSVHSPNVYEWLMSQSRKSSPDRGTNSAPVVNAGRDVSVPSTRNSLELTGNASDKDGKIVSYLWKKTGGGSVEMLNTNTAVLTIKNYQPGRYSFELTVTDDRGTEATDAVIVDVVASPTLQVSAGPDVTTTSKQVTLKGKGQISSGKIVSYEWIQAAGQKVKLEGTNTAALTVKQLKQGSYVFRLRVRDDKGNEASDEMKLVVNAKKQNKSPKADAGHDLKVNLPVASVRLKGSASSPNGKIIAHEWVQVSGRKVTINRAKTLNPVLTNIKTPGTRAFKLIVRDETGQVRVDHVKVFVVEPATLKKSASEDSVVIVDAPGVTEDTTGSDHPPFDLGREAWEPQYQVIVYDDRGRKLYAGPWREDTYQSTFTNPGFFVYQVWEGARRVHTGKLIIR